MNSPSIPDRYVRRVGRVIVLVASVVVAGAVGAATAHSADSVGVVDPTTGIWYLRDDTGATTSFYYGVPGDTPIVGDWDCDGVDTPGLYRRSDGFVYLRNSNTQGVADVRFFFGNPGDIPIAGDFDGDGCDTVSLYRPSEGQVYVIDRLGADGTGLGAATTSFLFGVPGDVPFSGDFDGDGVDSVALHRPSTGSVFVRHDHRTGPADSAFVFGAGSDLMFAGDWDGTATDTAGVFRPATATFYLRYMNTTGTADETFRYGTERMVPVAGSFGRLPGGDDAPGSFIDLPVVPREAWGAAPAIPSRMREHHMVRLTVHHAGDQTHVTGPERFRSWQRWHLDRGWGDLAYHYIIGVDGTVYEGRDTRYAGDTGTNYDPDGHFLVVVEGNFEVEYPTAEQLESLVRVLAWASTEFDIDPNTIAGHRDHASTACPGGHLYPYVASGDLEADVRALIADG
ncbi:MAG: N-acetylmuramoyl-L-alanine amidase [Acidimicrobiia bacterium]|nr:N-acetylmuramoyl-L-alanine amidase [Acidimicrobiia bacterium]